MFGWFKKKEPEVVEALEDDLSDGPLLVVFELEDDFVDFVNDYVEDGELIGQFLFKLHNGLVLETVFDALDKLDPLTREKALSTYSELNSSKQGLEELFQDKLNDIRSAPCIRPTQVFINPQEMLLNELDKDF